MNFPGNSFTGTIEDVASFCRRSVRTVHEWMSAGLIGFDRQGRSIWFRESQVVEFCLQDSQRARRMKPSEAEEQVRADWRAHIGARGQSLAEIELRVQILEALALERREVAA